MARKQELRSEETKKSILAAAGKLFADHGYDAVTMREIAKEAGCSHTTIYIYFKDKEALLHQLSMPPLETLQERLEQILENGKSPDAQIREVSLAFIRFCLENRNMYGIFFTVKAERVDAAEPALEINRMRNELFALFMRVLRGCFQADLDEAKLLLFSRIYFYMLHGIVATYTSSEEPLETLLERLHSTFDASFEVLLLGLRQKL